MRSIDCNEGLNFVFGRKTVFFKLILSESLSAELDKLLAGKVNLRKEFLKTIEGSLDERLIDLI